MQKQGNKEIIYMDYAATAPLCEEALEAMQPFLVPGTAGLAAGTNANSLHSTGRAAYSAMEAARKEVAKAVGARRPNEIVFTSGATEADNMAIFGLAEGAVEKRRLEGRGDFTPHVITSAIEHHAVLRPVIYLEKHGYDVTYLQPSRNGFIEVEVLENALRPETVLVSVQTANSETGSIQPIQELARVAHANGALFHTDATQALGKIPFSVEEMGVDAASFSAHKIGGPKGVGALYLKQRTPFQAKTLGGRQENDMRSGTQNVCGMVGFAAAVQASTVNVEDESFRLRQMRDKLYDALTQMNEVEATVEVEKGSVDFLPNIVNVMLAGIESETSVLRFDTLGIQVSGGSACSSNSLESSHVLRALGINNDRALTELRLSLGRYTTQAEIDAVIEAMGKVLNWDSR